MSITPRDPFAAPSPYDYGPATYGDGGPFDYGPNPYGDHASTYAPTQHTSDIERRRTGRLRSL